MLVCFCSCIPIFALVAFMQNESRTCAAMVCEGKEVEGRCKGCAPIPPGVLFSYSGKETAAQGSAANPLETAWCSLRQTRSLSQQGLHGPFTDCASLAQVRLSHANSASGLSLTHGWFSVVCSVTRCVSLLSYVPCQPDPLLASYTHVSNGRDRGAEEGPWAQRQLGCAGKAFPRGTAQLVRQPAPASDFGLSSKCPGFPALVANS